MDENHNSQIIENLQDLHSLLLSEETLQSTLERVTHLACTTISGCDSAGVTIVEDSKASTTAATDDFTFKIDHDQYDNREGPCLHALSSQEVVVVDDISSDSRWPAFAAAATGHGLGSVLSLPLAARNEPLGALNLYSKRTHSFDEDDRSLGKLFASQASVAISNAQAYEGAIRLAKQLKKAIESREVIGEAKGLIMAQEGVTDDEAFEMLKKLSQNKNVKLREVAQKVVDEAIKRPS